MVEQRRRKFLQKRSRRFVTELIDFHEDSAIDAECEGPAMRDREDWVGSTVHHHRRMSNLTEPFEPRG